MNRILLSAGGIRSAGTRTGWQGNMRRWSNSTGRWSNSMGQQSNNMGQRGYSTGQKVGVLMMNMGGPRTQDDVGP
ncbi:hypothetical protein EV180_003445, partial [Coemansia sp. RSA 518]